MELYIMLIVLAAAVMGFLGLAVGYWWKGVEIKEAELKERLRLATTNTIKNANGDEYIKKENRVYYLKGTETE